MLGFIKNTLRSFYSPSHYEWVADYRHGLELTYLFQLGMVLAAAGFGVAFYIAHDTGMDIDTVMQIAGRSRNVDLIFELTEGIPGAPYVILSISWAIGFMLAMINAVIIYAIGGQLLNFLFKANLGFAQMVRISVYAMLASSVFALILMRYAMTHELPDHAVTVGMILIYSFYMVFAVSSAKS